jgi:hypothetical protein
MFKMFSCLLLLAALLLGLSAPQPLDEARLSALTVSDKLDVIIAWIEEWEETSVPNLIKVADNQTKQLLADLQVLKGRQVVSGFLSGFQFFIVITYMITITILCVVKQCNKHRESLAQEEFELLEAKLAASKSKRRAAAARASKQSSQ